MKKKPRKTIMGRHIKKFHDELVDWASSAAVVTLRRAAMELDEYIFENTPRDGTRFVDAMFLSVVLQFIEYAVQQKSTPKWTVKRARREMRGGSARNYHGVRVDPKMREELINRMRLFYEDNASPK